MGNYSMRGPEEDYLFDWVEVLKNNGSIILDTLGPIPVLKQANGQDSKTRLRINQRETDGHELAHQCLGLVSVALAKQGRSLSVVRISPPDQDALSEDEDISTNVKQYVTKAYLRAVTGQHEADTAFIVDLKTDNENQHGLDIISTELLMQFMSFHESFMLHKEQGDFSSIQILPVFVVESDSPMSKSSSAVEGYYARTFRQSPYHLIDTRSFDEKHLRTLVKDITEEEVPQNNKTLETILSEYGGNANLAIKVAIQANERLRTLTPDHAFNLETALYSSLKAVLADSTYMTKNVVDLYRDAIR